MTTQVLCKRLFDSQSHGSVVSVLVDEVASAIEGLNKRFLETPRLMDLARGEKLVMALDYSAAFIEVVLEVDDGGQGNTRSYLCYARTQSPVYAQNLIELDWQLLTD